MPVISALNVNQLAELVASIARAPAGAFASVDRAVLTAAAAKLTGDSPAASGGPPCKRAKEDQNLTGGAFVDAAVESTKLVMFSKTTCPFCKKAKSLLGMYVPDLDQSNDAKVIEINLRDDMSEIQDHLLAKVGKRSVPQLFIGGVSDRTPGSASAATV